MRPETKMSYHPTFRIQASNDPGRFSSTRTARALEYLLVNAVDLTRGAGFQFSQWFSSYIVLLYYFLLPPNRIGANRRNHTTQFVRSSVRPSAAKLTVNKQLDLETRASASRKTESSIIFIFKVKLKIHCFCNCAITVVASRVIHAWKLECVCKPRLKAVELLSSSHRSA